MEKNSIIKYYSSNLNNTESIVIYDDEIIYVQSDLKVTSKLGEEPTKEKTIKIKDKFFVDAIVLGNLYMPMKQEMINTYNKIKSLDPRELHRPKNTSKKNIVINDKDFSANIDMFIEETGEIFEQFISSVKKVLISQINK